MSELQIPLWLSIGLAIFVGLVAVWQVPRIRVRLSGDYSTERAKPEGVSGFKHWGKLLAGLVLFLVIGVFGEAWLWTQQTYEMAGIKYDFGEDAKGDKKHESSLPMHYTLKKVLWQLGFTPLPTLLNIPAGEFNMGSEDGEDNEKPIHKVTIPNSFAMSQHEITFEQYDYFIWQIQKAGILQEIEGKEVDYRYPFDEGWGRDNRPVINVSWWDTQAYANWLSKKINQQCRLPSEAEWEYAAREGTTTKYPWSNEVGVNNANCDGCEGEFGGKQTAPVGSSESKTYGGLQDLHGNVWEWVQDPWHENYEGSPINGEAWEVDGDFSRRVLRGGSWNITPVDLRSAYRDDVTPDLRGDSFGFRIVCSSH